MYDEDTLENPILKFQAGSIGIKINSGSAESRQLSANPSDPSFKPPTYSGDVTKKGGALCLISLSYHKTNKKSVHRHM